MSISKSPLNPIGTERLCAAFLLPWVLLAAVGCDSGPERYSVSGEVQVEGQPVPLGRLVFTPDYPKGNAGPQGLAEIEQGKITSTPRKVVGGPHWVQIQAFDGVPYEGEEMRVEYGKALMPMQNAPVDLPKADAKLSVSVTKSSKGQYSIDITAEED